MVSGLGLLGTHLTHLWLGIAVIESLHLQTDRFVLSLLMPFTHSPHAIIQTFPLWRDRGEA